MTPTLAVTLASTTPLGSAAAGPAGPLLAIPPVPVLPGPNPAPPVPPVLPGPVLPGPVLPGPVLPGPVAPVPMLPGPAVPVAPGPGMDGTASWLTDTVSAAIGGLFRSVVTSALSPLLDQVGASLLSTPTPMGLPFLVELWDGSRAIAVAAYLLIISVGGLVVTGYQTVQTRYSAREILPRLVVGFVAANLSLPFCEQATIVSNALARAVLGNAVDPDRAGPALRELVTVQVVDGELWLIFLALALPVLLVVLLITYVVRVALAAMLVVAAPLALACHGLPQTETVGYWWWRAFAAVLAVQVGQSLAFAVGLRVVLTPVAGPAPPFLRLVMLIGLLVILVKIPFWVLGAVRVGRSRSLVGTAMRMWVGYQLLGRLTHRSAAATPGTGGPGSGGPGMGGGRRRGGPRPGPPPAGPAGSAPGRSGRGTGGRGTGDRGTRGRVGTAGPGLGRTERLSESGLIDPYTWAGRTAEGQYRLPLSLPALSPPAASAARRGPAGLPASTAGPSGRSGAAPSAGGRQLAFPLALAPTSGVGSARPGQVGGVRVGSADPFRGVRRTPTTPTRGRAVPRRPLPGRPVPGRAVPGRPVPGRAVPGRAVPGHTSPAAVPPAATPRPGRGPRRPGGQP